MNTHADAPHADDGPHCPACGFRVFNRRYPKCESCGAELPESIAYSAAERHALIETEEELARAVARAHRPESEPTPFASSDAAIISAIVESRAR